jgi:hypothetical protein
MPFSKLVCLLKRPHRLADQLAWADSYWIGGADRVGNPLQIAEAGRAGRAGRGRRGRQGRQAPELKKAGLKNQDFECTRASQFPKIYYIISIKRRIINDKPANYIFSGWLRPGFAAKHP